MGRLSKCTKYKNYEKYENNLTNMEYTKEIKKDCYAVKITANENGEPVGRAFLYIIYNDLHDKPYGLVEDIWVEENFRGYGLGTQLLHKIITEAKERDCYKLVADSRLERTKVHAWYEREGFKKYGFEFRYDL